MSIAAEHAPLDQAAPRHGWGRWLLAALLFLGAAEATCRLDDYLFFGIPLLATPNRDIDLTLRDEHGLHGRPNGQYRKWRLNEEGFRGPSLADSSAPGHVRVMILGASETFGLYESDQHEYPAQLGRLLRDGLGEQVEVINAAMAGMSLKSMLPYWERWASRYHPQVVLIYPSPLFYLDDEPPGAQSPEVPTEPTPGWIERSRFAERLRDTMRQSALIRWVRLEILLLLNRRQQREADVFHEVPQDRLNLFRTDLAALVDAIQKQGAKPILITHACKASSPLNEEDLPDLKAMQVFFPRATPKSMVAFEEAAGEVVRQLGRAKHVPVFDAGAQLNGRRDEFADLVHFNDAGAQRMAHFLADQLEPLLHPAP